MSATLSRACATLEIRMTRCRAIVADVHCVVGGVRARDASRRQPPPFELDEATVAQLQQWMQAGRYTSRRLVDLYLARIEAIDRSGPALRSVIEVNPEARVDRRRARCRAQGQGAARSAARHPGPHQGQHRHRRSDDDDGRLARARGIDRGARRVRRRAAARGRRGDSRQDEPQRVGELPLHEVDERLERRAAGRRRTRTRSTAIPCGSSSGTGAAIAANLAAVGVGTETDGSIVCPSSVNGLVGIKPTVGLVSRSGIIPISHSQDTAGPMTRTVADAAVLLSAMAGVDRARRRRRRRQPAKACDYTKALDAGALKGRADRRRPEAVLRLQPARPTRVIDAAIAEMKARGRGHRRSRGHSDGGDARRLRARDPALRVQGGSERLSGRLGPSAQGALARGRDRLQRAREGARDAVLRPGAVRQAREERAADVAGVSRGARDVPGARARARASTR